jgi:phosphoglycerate dehydrogenase-like enzyme
MLDIVSRPRASSGVGGAGAEAARLCAAFGMQVIGVDPRVVMLWFFANRTKPTPLPTG